eukprot:g2290.t1
MSTKSQNWSVSYTPTISPPRPPIQLDDDAHGPEALTSNEPPLGSRSPLPRRQGATRPPSTLLLLPGRPAGGWRGGGSSNSSSSRPVAGGRSDAQGRVRFHSVVQLILVPSRKDMDSDLSQELWWNQEDYLQFRLGAIVEDNAGLLRRPLRKRRSRRALATRANRATSPPDPRLAQALQNRSGCSGGSGGRTSGTGMGPVRQHFRLHGLPARGASPPLRFQQLVTPPPSPEKPLCAGAGAGAAATPGVNESPAESASFRHPTGGERGSVEDFDGFVSVCGLPGSIATTLEC